MYPTASSMSKTTKHLKLDSLLKEVEIQVLISADEFLKVSKTRLLAHEKQIASLLKHKCVTLWNSTLKRTHCS